MDTVSFKSRRAKPEQRPATPQVDSAPRNASSNLRAALRSRKYSAGYASARKNSLASKVLTELMAEAEMKLESVLKVFDNTVFGPIKSQKSLRTGFRKAQLQPDNVSRAGHCLACDSFTNLADFIGSRPPLPECYLLQADRNSCCALTLVGRVPTNGRG